MARPIVSVLMTAFNREAYIGEAIESVLASDFADFELIVVDDRSADRTFDIASDYARRDGRVKLHVNAENLGDYPNRNRAAELANGTYIKYLDSDDLIYPHGLGAMVRCMQRYPEAGFGLSQIAEPQRPQPVMLTPLEFYERNFFGDDLASRAPGSSIIRLDAFRKLGGFAGARYVGDQEFWLRVGRYYPMVAMPRDLVWDRTHGQQEKIFETDGLSARREIDVAALLHDDCPLSQARRHEALSAMARKHARNFWSLLLRAHAPGAALKMRRSAALSWWQVLRYPVLRDGGV